MLNVVSFKPPKFKPMPSELTPAVISGATLPVKIGIAQRAIAACCDLSELLTWKDKLAALAAAAKMARMPEMARSVNRVHKEAIFRMGEILLQYNGVARNCRNIKTTPEQIDRVKSQLKAGKSRRSIALDIGIGVDAVSRIEKNPRYGDPYGASERMTAALNAGIRRDDAMKSTRLAAAPKEIREKILADDGVIASPQRMVWLTPKRCPRHAGKRWYQSDAMRNLMAGTTTNGSPNNRGLVSLLAFMKGINLDLIAQLTDEERVRTRKTVIEMQEILDEIDRRLGPAS